MIKILFFIIGFIAIFVAGVCFGVLICLMAVKDMIPPAFPNYWKAQEIKKKKNNK